MIYIRGVEEIQAFIDSLKTKPAADPVFKFTCATYILRQPLSDCRVCGL